MTGTELVVQQAMMSAVTVLSDAVAEASSPNLAVTHLAKASAFSIVRPETKTRESERTREIISTCARACTPVPKMPRVRASGRARWRVATAEPAAVRAAVRAEPSMTASGIPVTGSVRT